MTRSRAWADSRINIDPLVAGAPQTINLLLNAPAVDSITVIRIIGDITVMKDVTTTQVDSLSTVDVGIGVTSVEAFAALGVSLPNPSIDTQSPPRGWLYVATQPVMETVRASADSGFVAIQARFVFDIRAMRKIDKGILFLTLEQNNVVVGGSMSAVGRVRALCLT